MAESKSAGKLVRSRRQRRFILDLEDPAVLKFHYPGKNGVSLEAHLRDISSSGVSLVLPRQLPGLRVGDILRDIDAFVAGRVFTGDLLVMHLTPGNEAGAICGGLFFPEGDEDLITVRLVIRRLQTQEA